MHAAHDASGVRHGHAPAHPLWLPEDRLVQAARHLTTVVLTHSQTRTICKLCILESDGYFVAGIGRVG